MSCEQCNPCNNCGAQADCTDRCLDINLLPGSACTYAFTHAGCTFNLNLKEGIENCQTPERIALDLDGCTVNFYNSLYESSNGQKGEVQKIDVHQLGGCISLGDLNNVADSADHPDNCAFLVYKKNAGCGDGCEGVDDAWQAWNPLKNKKDGLHYVMGMNDEGCPVLLNDPTGSFGTDSNTKYWWGMWRPDKQFGYIQPDKADLPKDENGNTLVISQDSNGKPIIGPFKEAEDLVTITTARTSTVTEQPYYGQSDFDIRMDSKEGNDGTKDATDDMICSVDWCSDYTGSTAIKRTISVTVGPSGTNFDEDYKRDYARHFQSEASDWAMPGHLDVVVPRGQHLKFHAEGVAADDDLAHFRMHQVHVVWRRLHPYTEYRK